MNDGDAAGFAEIRERHGRTDQFDVDRLAEFCLCGERWPCDAAWLVSFIDRLPGGRPMADHPTPDAADLLPAVGEGDRGER